MADDSWHYLDKPCSICGGKIRSYFGFDKCEECGRCYLTDSNAARMVLYNIKNDFTDKVAQEVNDLSPFNLKSDLKCPICGENKLDEAIIDCFDVDHPLRQPTKEKTYWCRNCRKEIIPSEHDSITLHIKENGQGSAYRSIGSSDLIPNMLKIDCEKIRLFQKGLDIEFEIDPKKLENINVIEINGYRFIKEKQI